MRNRKLPEEGNLAHEIVERVFNGLRTEEIVEAAKRLLDLALNYDSLCEYTRAQIIGRICWKFGLEPPDSIQDRLV
jgi:hypothetical protein